MNFEPNELGYWGEFGGRFVPETLMSPLEELTDAYFAVRDDADFQAEFLQLSKGFFRSSDSAFLCEKIVGEIWAARRFI